MSGDVDSYSNINASLGAGYTDTTEYLDGKMDQVRYYTQALSASEISQLYNE